MSKCDLHIHSRHSARSEEWLFRRFDFPDSYSDPKQLYEQLLKRGMDYVTITDHDSIDGCLRNRASASDTSSGNRSRRIFRRTAASCTFWFGESQNSNIATSKASATTFSICNAICKARKSRMPLRIRSTASTANSSATHLEQLILLFKHFEAINGLRDALLSDLTQTLSETVDPGEDRRAGKSSRSRAHASGAVEENLRRRLGRSRRTIRRLSFHRNAGCGFCRKISRAHSQRRLHRARPGRNAVNPVARILQHSRVFHPGPVSRKARAERGAAGENVLAVHGGPRPDRVHSRRKKRTLSRKAFCREKFLNSSSRRTCRYGKSFPVISRGRKLRRN